MKRIHLNLRSESAPTIGWHRGGSSPLPPGAALKALVAATAVALVLPNAQLANAQTLGELDVRSRLGERFFGAIPIQSAPGILDPRCIRVVPNPNAPAGAEPLQGARIRIGSADTVIIETGGSVTSPVVGLRLEVGCEKPVTRDYVVLGEGASVPGLTDAAPIAGRSQPTAAPPATVAARGASRAPTARVAPKRQPAAAPVEVRTAAPTIVQPPQPVAAPAASVPGPVPAGPSARPLPSPSAETSDTNRRLADLRARSDDHAAALLALDDRLTLLQKQAELLKAQLDQALASASVPAAQAGAAPTASAPAAASRQAAGSPASSPAAPLAVEAPARKEPGILDLLSDWRAAGGLAALLAGAFILGRRRRPMFKTAEPQSLARMSDDDLLGPPSAVGELLARAPAAHHEKTEAAAVAAPFTAAQTVEWGAAPQAGQSEQTAEWVAPPTTDTMPVPERSTAARSQVEAPGTGISREFHITQQFQPGTERVVALASPEEIVQQARTHYMEDGDIFRAIDLLEMAVSARKDSTRPWQALFAIYHREKMPERFQRLALAYRSAFGEDESWPAIRALGHVIDADNPLYRGEAPLEPLPDDLTERWLGVPLDFTAHLLANEMHDQLMSTYPGRKRRKRTAN